MWLGMGQPMPVVTEYLLTIEKGKHEKEADHQSLKKVDQENFHAVLGKAQGFIRHKVGLTSANVDLAAFVEMSQTWKS